MVIPTLTSCSAKRGGRAEKQFALESATCFHIWTAAKPAREDREPCRQKKLIINDRSTSSTVLIQNTGRAPFISACRTASQAGFLSFLSFEQ